MNTNNDYKSLKDIQFIIGMNIRNRCAEKKVSMMDLAEQVDLSYEYLRHIVSKGGKKHMSFYTMYKIAKTLDMSFDDFFKGV